MSNYERCLSLCAECVRRSESREYDELVQVFYAEAAKGFQIKARTMTLEEAAEEAVS